jgi:hypothetical protein
MITLLRRRKVLRMGRENKSIFMMVVVLVFWITAATVPENPKVIRHEGVLSVAEQDVSPESQVPSNMQSQSGNPLPPGTRLPEGKPLPPGTQLPEGKPLPLDSPLLRGTPLPMGTPLPDGKPLLLDTSLPTGKPLP